MLLHHDRVSCWDINDVPDREEIMAGLLKGPDDLLLYYRQETNAESGSSMVARRTVLLCCLVEYGCKEGLFICPCWGDTGSDPVSPIWGFADGVRVGDQWLTFIRVLEEVNQNITSWMRKFSAHENLINYVTVAQQFNTVERSANEWALPIHFSIQHDIKHDKIIVVETIKQFRIVLPTKNCFSTGYNIKVLCHNRTIRCCDKIMRLQLKYMPIHFQQHNTYGTTYCYKLWGARSKISFAILPL